MFQPISVCMSASTPTNESFIEPCTSLFFLNLFFISHLSYLLSSDTQFIMSVFIILNFDNFALFLIWGSYKSVGSPAVWSLLVCFFFVTDLDAQLPEYSWSSRVSCENQSQHTCWDVRLLMVWPLPAHIAWGVLLNQKTATIISEGSEPLFHCTSLAF